MNTPKKTGRTTPRKVEQSRLFIEKAREIGCEGDADEDEIMRRLASQKRPPPKPVTKKPKTKKPAK